MLRDSSMVGVCANNAIAPAHKRTAFRNMRAIISPPDSVHRALLRLLLACQGEARLFGGAFHKARAKVCAHGGAVFEAVPRSATGQPHVGEFGMPVQQE